ncbi:MAG TPA: N-acetyltransferase [Ilumatobacter sp.]|jgi:ribosomal protein S18 acetylase RimI-like enzyme|nr:N-acetyltransferase [Ilumatobacter sp.]
MITTRPATPADVAAITGLVQRAYAMYLPRMEREPQPVRDDYASLVADERVAVAVDEDSGAVVGAIVRWIVDGELYVDNVAVEPSAHGRGIGNLLLELAAADGRRSGCGRMWLYTNAVMTENVNFYQRRGFVEYDRRVDQGYDRIFFQRTL